MKDSVGRRYYYPLRSPSNPGDVTLIEISEAEYRALYPEIWRTRKQEQALGRCQCPRKMLWKCDGDCMICRYHTSGRVWSLDALREIKGDQLSDEAADPDRFVADSMLLQKLLKRLEELCPGANALGKLMLEGKSERNALDELGIKRSTYRYQLNKARQVLREEFGENF